MYSSVIVALCAFINNLITIIIAVVALLLHNRAVKLTVSAILYLDLTNLVFSVKWYQEVHCIKNHALSVMNFNMSGKMLACKEEFDTAK